MKRLTWQAPLALVLFASLVAGCSGDRSRRAANASTTTAPTTSQAGPAPVTSGGSALVSTGTIAAPSSAAYGVVSSGTVAGVPSAAVAASSSASVAWTSTDAVVAWMDAGTDLAELANLTAGTLEVLPGLNEPGSRLSPRAFSADGRMALFVDLDGTTVLYDRLKQERVALPGLQGVGTRLSGDASLVLAIEGTGSHLAAPFHLGLYDAAAGSMIPLPAIEVIPSGGPAQLSFDGSRIAYVASGQLGVRVYDRTSGTDLFDSTAAIGSYQAVGSPFLTADGGRLFFQARVDQGNGSSRGTVVCYDLAAQAAIDLPGLVDPSDDNMGISRLHAVTPDGRYLLVSGHGAWGPFSLANELAIFDVRGDHYVALDGLGDVEGVVEATLSPGGRYLVGRWSANGGALEAQAFDVETGLPVTVTGLDPQNAYLPLLWD